MERVRSTTVLEQTEIGLRETTGGRIDIGGGRSEKTSGSASVSPSRSLGTASVGVEQYVISERRANWDREAASVDQKQAELFHIQWNLIREQISTFSTELVALRGEMRALGERIPELEVRITQQLDMKVELEDEGRARKDADARASTELRDLSRSLSDALNNEARERMLGDDEALRLATQVKQLGEKEERDRRAGTDELSQRFQELLGAVEQERSAREEGDAALRNQLAGWRQSSRDLSQVVQDVMASLEQERADREQSDSGLRAQIAACRQDLAAEKAERSDEDQAHRRAMQTLEGQLLPMVKDLRIGLDAEAAERSAAELRLEKQIGDLRSALEAEAGQRGKLADDTERSLRDLKGALEQEARVRADEAGQNQAGLRRLQNQIEAETRDRNQAVDGLSEKLKALADALAHEARDRTAGDDETAKALRLLQIALEQEASQRGRDVEFARESLAAEAAERSAGDELGKRNLTVVSQRVELVLDQVRESLHIRLNNMADELVKCAQLWKETQANQLQAGVLSVSSTADIKPNNIFANADDMQSLKIFPDMSTRPSDASGGAAGIGVCAAASDAATGYLSYSAGGSSSARAAKSLLSS